jgi:hypothetical protein
VTTFGVLNELSGAGAASQAGTVPVSQVPLVCGAELYAEPSVTGLNTQPVDDHCALALLGSAVAGPARVDLEALCTQLLSQGSVALVRNDLLQPATQEHSVAAASVPPSDGRKDAAATGSFVLLDGLVTLDPAVPFTLEQFAQRFWAKVDGESKCVTRVFSRRDGAPSPSAPADEPQHSGSRQGGPPTWSVRDYTAFGTEDQQLIATASAPADAVVAYPNGLGILYRSQRAYRRLEGIFATIERMQSGVNSKTIISGYVGSVEQAHSELRRADRDVALFPTGATVHRVASTSAIDQLMREFETLLPLYLRRMHFVHFADGDQQSGVSRRLAMAPMLAFVEKTRRQLGEVVALCGGRLEFDDAAWRRVVSRDSR